MWLFIYFVLYILRFIFIKYSFMYSLVTSMFIIYYLFIYLFVSLVEKKPSTAKILSSKFFMTKVFITEKSPININTKIYY